MGTGFFGKVLWINLTEESFEEETVPEEIYRQYLGGYGLAVKLIFENMPAKIDPLSPESIFGFFPGLLTGTAAPFSGRYMLAGKSPLTGTWGDSNSGGTFGPEIKKCGYDAILFKGAAKTPKYVLISEDKKELLDASEIWGLDIIETESILKDKHGKFIKTAAIGQAGEKLSKISGIANDRGRIAARAGLGAIMGSKKLKALVLKGNKKISIYNKDKFLDLVKIYNKNGKKGEPGKFFKSILKSVPNLAKTLRRFRIGFKGPPNIIRKIYRIYGTCVGNTIASETNDSPIKNWSGIGMYDFPFKKSKALSANKIIKYKIREWGCYGCPVQCGGILKIPELNLEEIHQPEYETCCSFGALLLNNDLMSIFEINELCNRAAIDTISTGATIAFAIECFENGILTKEDTNGLELVWGNSKAIIELVKMIINRRGIGDILADGSKIAAERIGNESVNYAITSLGSEIPMHNPRFFPSLAFTYNYDPTPGRHTAASIDYINMGSINKFQKGFKLPKGWKKNKKKKQKGQKLVTSFHQVLSSVGLCSFSTLFGPYPFIDLIKNFTGWNISIDELIEIGLRIQTLRQSFTLREGIDIAGNKLPGRVSGHPPDKRGPTKGVSVEYEDFYKGYCYEMGWNPNNGYPLKETLKDLDLEFVIKDLY
ncbi:MAG: aldehyde ferredoxin oxidoreductase family protein [Candidatus Lokiarchaeota archaeon]|nr:aldehyde ferredoxin oxidoreductase family protein [Candidatus Lokiarchaeota archaeon]MCK4479976.1 aldehyde ferredoxin oxidoreductase family protein [Candidatus Lokiarchaeota archaeon]